LDDADQFVEGGGVVDEDGFAVDEAGLGGGLEGGRGDFDAPETLLEAFKSIYLNTVAIGEQIHLQLTPLSDLQMQILSLLGFSLDIYSRLTANSQKPP
jgi:hypothetical protein